MKRTNLVLDEELLKQAVHVLGVKTYSAAVNTALSETLRMKKVLGLQEFFGSRIWEGNLSEMREDQPVRRRKSQIAKKRAKK